MAEIIDFKTRQSHPASPTFLDDISTMPWVIAAHLEGDAEISITIAHETYADRVGLIKEAVASGWFVGGCEEDRGVPFAAASAVASILSRAMVVDTAVQFLGVVVEPIPSLVGAAIDGVLATFDAISQAGDVA